MSDTYRIKKYDNRRLYDTSRKRFLNLEDLRELIRAGHTLKVEDSAGRDITRQILLQVIVEAEDGGQPLLSTELLHALARFYGDVMQSVFGRYLDESVRTFLEQQTAWRGSVEDALGKGPMTAFNKLVRDQVDLWTNAQKNALGALIGEPPKKKPSRRRR